MSSVQAVAGSLHVTIPPPPLSPLSTREGYSPDVVSFNTAIDACASREKWQEAVELLEVDMPGAKVRLCPSQFFCGVCSVLGARGGRRDKSLV